MPFSRKLFFGAIMLTSVAVLALKSNATISTMAWSDHAVLLVAAGGVLLSSWQLHRRPRLW